tara:strand:+ start:106 stop:516 length:411 start_codon:yes stop_codon:yes gene_type:complete
MTTHTVRITPPTHTAASTHTAAETMTTHMAPILPLLMEPVLIPMQLIVGAMVATTILSFQRSAVSMITAISLPPMNAALVADQTLEIISTPPDLLYPKENLKQESMLKLNKNLNLLWSSTERTKLKSKSLLRSKKW